jgi:hypothetical protein
LFNGDLKYNVDFRSVYAGLLEEWLKTKSEPILGRKFTPLPLVCSKQSSRDSLTVEATRNPAADQFFIPQTARSRSLYHH